MCTGLADINKVDIFCLLSVRSAKGRLSVRTLPLSIMVSESKEVDVTEENDAWFYIDVYEISSNDHGNEDDCIARIYFIETMKILLLLDQRTVIIVFLLMVYTSFLLTMKLFITMHMYIEQTDRTQNAD